MMIRVLVMKFRISDGIIDCNTDEASCFMVAIIDNSSLAITNALWKLRVFMQLQAL